MNRFLVARVAAAALVLGVTGCSEDEPRPQIAEPTDTPSSSPTHSESSNPELEPEQVVEAWVAGWNELNESGRAASVRKWSAARCASCEDLIDPIVELYANGGQITTKGWRSTNIERSREFATDSFVYAAIISAPGTTMASADASPVRFESEKNILEFALTRGDGSWRVRRIAYL